MMATARLENELPRRSIFNRIWLKEPLPPIRHRIDLDPSEYREIDPVIADAALKGGR